MSASGSLGPVDYLVVEFPARARTFPAPLATELASLVDAELVCVLDLLVIEKAQDGDLQVYEFEDLEDLEDIGDLTLLGGRLGEWLGADDIADLSAAVRPATAAGVIVWEHTWAAPFVDLAGACGAQLVASGRIPPDRIVRAAEPVEPEEGDGHAPAS